jgi:hypothetical protein
MTNPLHNFWFDLGIFLFLLSFGIRIRIDRTDDPDVWWSGLNSGVILAIASLASLILGIVQITS